MKTEWDQRLLREQLAAAAAEVARSRDLCEASREISSASRGAREELHRTHLRIHESLSRVHRAEQRLSQLATLPTPDATPSAFAGADLPAQAQIAAYVLQPPSGPGWVHELKQDGYRLLCRCEGHAVGMLDSDDRDWSEHFPSLAEMLRSLEAQSVQLDGEVVVCDESGLSSRARMDEAIASGDDAPAFFSAFDMLSLNGEELRVQPLVERKRRLRRLLHDVPQDKVRYAGHLCQNGAKMLQQAVLLGLEGIVSKRADAPYRAGLSLDWRLTRCAGH